MITGDNAAAVERQEVHKGVTFQPLREMRLYQKYLLASRNVEGFEPPPSHHIFNAVVPKQHNKFSPLSWQGLPNFRGRTKLTCDVELIIIWLLLFSNVRGDVVAERLQC